MSSAVSFVPDSEPYLKFLATVWHRHGCPPITKAYFETSLKPLAQHLEHGDWVERSYAFEEALGDNGEDVLFDFDEALEEATNWLYQEISKLSDEARNAYFLACDNYDHCDLCCQVSFFAIQRFTWNDLLQYLHENGTDEPEW